jgi:hypothetical protein
MIHAIRRRRPAYWATFRHRNGAYLARTLHIVRERESKDRPLPVVTGCLTELGIDEFERACGAAC